MCPFTRLCLLFPKDYGSPELWGEGNTEWSRWAVRKLKTVGPLSEKRNSVKRNTKKVKVDFPRMINADTMKILYDI